ncbi:hypothetical protein LWE69_12650 [Paenibacillus sp. UKAQ_18]|nr:hypothetical protein [Paenibacillus sp. UKAQ_18]
MAKYRKKPIVVEARQLTREKEVVADILEWVNEIDMSTSIIGRNACVNIVFEEGLAIETPEGVMTASFGDYIIQGIRGEFYPCKPDIFEQTYEKVDDGAA